MEREQLSWQERGQLWLRLIIRLVLAAAAVVLVAKLGPPLLSLFAPFVAALIVAALLNPAVRWLQRRLGWSRKLLSLLLVVVIFGVIGGCLGILTYAAANELVSLAQNWSGDADPGGGLFRSDGGPVCPGDGPAAPVGGGDGGGHRQRPHPAPPGGGPHRPAECGQGGHRLGHAGAGVPAGPGGLCDGLLFPHRGLPLSPHAGGPSTWTRACSASSSR